MMKKQILFLTFFVLAFITSLTNSYGQLGPSSQALPPLSCAANANFLHPIAGESYTYQMDATTGAEAVDQWTWFVTKNPAFISGGVITSDSLKVATGQLLAASPHINNPSVNNNVQITWSPEVLTNTLYQGTPSTTVFPSPTFVVGYGTGVNCSDNIKVYEINPIMNFTIDIANINPETDNTMVWDKDTAQCVDVVNSATYTAGNLVMDYGTDSLFFEVAAANFNTDFTPYFTLISGLQDVQTAVVTLHPTLADAHSGTNVLGTTNWTAASTGWDTGIQLTASDPTDVAAGVSFFVKVVITNSTFESLTASPFVLAVDARDKTNTGIWDMEDDDCTALTFSDAADQVDQATHIVNPRPTITGANVPDSNLAEPNNIVPKNP